MTTQKRNPLEVIREDERIAVFIDGANLYSAAKGLGFDIDYRKLREVFGNTGRFVRVSYYTALIDDTEEFVPLRPLLDWLDYNGYSLVTKPAKEYTDSTGRRRYKGDMDVELAVDMLEAASTVDHIVLFSGDGDFYPVIEALRRKGVRVTTISTLKTNPPMVSDDLRRVSDNFIELVDLQSLISRPIQDRADRSERFS